MHEYLFVLNHKTAIVFNFMNLIHFVHLQMRQWIRDSENDVVTNFSEVGSNSETACELQTEHRQIQDSCSVSLILLLFIPH